MCPGRSRVPYPLAVWMGMAVLMMELGFPRTAVFAIALSCQTQRMIHRPKSKVQVTAGGSEARTVEKPKVHSPLRESGKTSQELGAGAKQEQRVLRGLRAGLRRHHARSQEVAQFSQPRRSAEGRYVADLFSGEGGVALTCERLGFASCEWDIRHGHQCDLTSRAVLRKLKCDVKAGKVLAVMLAPPCSSFSVARDRTKLSHQDWAKIELGNAFFRSRFSLIRLLDKFSVPWILENPHSSKCWYLPFFTTACLQNTCANHCGRFLSIWYTLEKTNTFHVWQHCT